MPRNTLNDLNNHLFEQLERLNDDELTGEALDRELSRTKAFTDVAKEIISNGRLMLNAQQHADEYGYTSSRKVHKLPEVFKIETEDD